MRLRTIQTSTITDAVVLLTEGFGELCKTTWHDCLLKIKQHADRQGGGPIGYIASKDGADIGICLTLPMPRAVFEPEERQAMNLAGFYLRPRYQWMAALFLREVMTTRDAEYVDVTPSESMQKINEHLGFMTFARGLSVVPLGLAVWRHARRTRVFEFDTGMATLLPDPVARIMEDHAELGCICLIVEQDGICNPLILAHKSRAGLSSARIILAKDRIFVRKILGPLARYLLRSQVFFLELDANSDRFVRESFQRSRSYCVQSTELKLTSEIDHTYSELVFVK
jgi:hypothetical protein